MFITEFLLENSLELSNNILKHKQKIKISNIFFIANEKLFVQKILKIEYIKKIKSNNS